MRVSGVTLDEELYLACTRVTEMTLHFTRELAPVTDFEVVPTFRVIAVGRLFDVTPIAFVGGFDSCSHDQHDITRLYMRQII